MPFTFSDQTLPSGTPYLRIDVEGQVELEDGEAFAAQLRRPEFGAGKVLSVVASGTEYSTRVRKYFPSINDDFEYLAAVVTSPIVRTMINLMVRLMHGGGGTVRLFTDEAKALTWLDQHEPS